MTNSNSFEVTVIIRQGGPPEQAWDAWKRYQPTRVMAMILVAATAFTSCRDGRDELLDHRAGLVGVSEMTLRLNATVKPSPDYPAESVLSRSYGVAVAQVETTPTGRVRSVRMLQAPDAYIAKSVESAVSQWVFEEIRVRGFADPSGMHGKLTFYFELRGNVGLVLAPDEIDGPVSKDEPSHRRAFPPQ